MSFADNLQYLRKREKITQEELAEQLEVSRQSVSKWETGEAFPETEKLIALCDIFDVNMDDLMRGDLVHSAQESVEKTEKDDKVYVDDIGFCKHMDGFSLKISAGVFMILAGVAFLMTFLGFSHIAGEKFVNLFIALGLASLFLPVAAAVFLFIISGISHSEFVRVHGEAKNYFITAQRAAFNKKFSIGIAVAVSLIIIAATGMVVSFAVLEDVVFTSSAVKDFTYNIIVAAFMLVLSFSVGALCYLGIQHEKYDVEEYNKEHIGKNKSKKEKVKDGIQAAIMLTATAVFLLIGFVWNIWHPSWVAFPIGGILCAVVSVIFEINK